MQRVRDLQVRVEKNEQTWYNKENTMQETEMREYLKNAIFEMTEEQAEYVIRRIREIWNET